MLKQAVRRAGMMGALSVLVAAASVSWSTAQAEDNEPTVIKNPYANVNWDRIQHFRANFHSHTVYSDGMAEPDVLIAAYADAGYDILAIADHDNYHTTYGGERETVPTHETTWPWTQWIDEEPSTIWDRDGMETSAFYPGLGHRGMLAIRGNELTTEPHIVSLFNDLGYSERYMRQLDREEQTDHDRMSAVQAKGGLAYWAHPSDYVPGGIYADRVSAEPLTWDEALDHIGRHIIEYNSTLGIEMQLGGGDKGRLDSELHNRLLEKYYRDHDIFVMGSDDNHSQSVPERASHTIVLAEELTEESVRHALTNGHKFAGHLVDSPPEFKRITVDEGDKVITVDAENYDAIHWVKNGERVNEGASINYSDMRDAILRFEVEADGGTFFSQAFYID